VRRLLVTFSVVPSSLLLVTLKNEELSSSETSVLTRVTRRNISEHTILHSQRRENLKSYIIDTEFYLYMIVLLNYKSFTEICPPLHTLVLGHRQMP
jgi:hypothetical protein